MVHAPESPIGSDLSWVEILVDGLPWVDDPESAFPKLTDDQRAAQELALWSETQRGKKKSELRQQLDGARSAMILFRRTGEWRDATPIHFLALHCFQHHLVLGVQPIVSKPDLFIISHHFKKNFNADPYELADYMRWVWRGEVARVRALRANDMDYARTSFSVRRFFHGDLINSYRVYCVSQERGTT